MRERKHTASLGLPFIWGIWMNRAGREHPWWQMKGSPSLGGWDGPKKQTIFFNTWLAWRTCYFRDSIQTSTRGHVITAVSLHSVTLHETRERSLPALKEPPHQHHHTNTKSTFIWTDIPPKVFKKHFTNLVFGPSLACIITLCDRC